MEVHFGKYFQNETSYQNSASAHFQIWSCSNKTRIGVVIALNLRDKFIFEKTSNYRNFSVQGLISKAKAKNQRFVVEISAKFFRFKSCSRLRKSFKNVEGVSQNTPDHLETFQDRSGRFSWKSKKIFSGSIFRSRTAVFVRISCIN